MRAAARAALACAIAIAGPAVARAETPPSFDYLYVRAHEGSASGGHAAIRFGSAIFDFQHRDGLVVPRREDARRFQHVYRVLENRSIERSRVAASAETVALLREAFERRLLAQGRQLEIAAGLDADRALLADLARGVRPELAVRGAGFFAAARPHESAPALRELHDRIAAALGSGFLAQRDSAARRAIESAVLDPPDPTPIAVEPLAYPTARDPLTRRLARSLAARRAVAVLTAPHALSETALAGDVGIALDESSAARLRSARARAIDAAVRLAQSRRPDWGEAFLLAAARAAAIDASLASGRLRVLDALPHDARRLRATTRRRALVPALLAEARGDLAAARDAFFAASDLSEAALATLEAAATRVAALRAVEQGAGELRVAVGTILPEAIAPVALDPLPRATLGAVARAHRATEAASASHRRRLDDRYGYDLLRRNCVTEIFRTVELALAERAGASATADAVREESTRRLGGHVDPVARGGFVPFVSDRRVRSTWRVAERAHLPSVREHAVERDASFAAVLRESNAFSATFYEPGEQAGFFLFFTEDAGPLRPILGALNLSAALLRTGIGFATLPFDGGDGLRDGLDGALWSVPELLFANVRKGTSEYVAPELRPPAE